MSDTRTQSEAKRREEDVQAFWSAKGIFKRSEEKDAPEGPFVFYDGPPFANGLPHYGHILAGTIKDAIPRYKTMRGYRVLRKWGWDCHGLPVENLIEKELGLSTKKDIEEFGVAKFNESARVSIMKDEASWKTIVPQLGRWVDMENDYKTMDPTFTESVWWSLRRLHDKGLLYEGFKSMHLCPRCETTLSNFEVSQGYKDITDISVYVSFPVAGKDYSLVAWTTTPWTLPGNAALAVNPDIDYVRFTLPERKGEWVTSRAFFEKKFNDTGKQIGLMKGSALLGTKYAPLFPFFAEDVTLKNRERGWKVYAAPFVSEQDGTGVVHVAPAFGQDDMELGERERLPFIQHVTHDGKFKEGLGSLSGKGVKPKDDHQAGDVKTLKVLALTGRLFEKEKITHSYPHCWRCDTPLLNYAASSWFVKVSSMREKLVRENKNIHWVPREVGESRFGNWLASARDWAISRTRYWGAPLPIWRNKESSETAIIGSIEELLSRTKRSGNTYTIMRHGEARSNAESFVDSGTVSDNHLTPLGKEQVAQCAQHLAGQGIDLIVASPILRAQETAQIVLETLELPRSALTTDARLREVEFGNHSGRPRAQWLELFATYFERMSKRIPGTETSTDVRRRVGDFLFDLERRYRGKRILIITHAEPGWLMEQVAACRSCTPFSDSNKPYREQEAFLGNAAFRTISFIPYPHNPDFDLDLHRPYIDAVVLEGKGGGELRRVPDVFDCWYESGSMPYGQFHYPFENRDRFEPLPGLFGKRRGYPADFIAEGLDQTRGWFYSLIVLGTALFGRAPYRNVIVNGTVLAEDGQKMSKRLRNYPDPLAMVERYGADALRYYLLSSPLLRGEDLNFSEKGVSDVEKKLLMRLENVRAFYELYAPGNEQPTTNNQQRTTDNKQSTARDTKASPHVLDRYILSRLGELEREVREGMERYELDAASRPIMGFVDDLSTWYLRRSRERFKGEDAADAGAARETLRHTLFELAHILAPFTPFYAEYLYQKLRTPEDPESVHLSWWPTAMDSDTETLRLMQVVRRAVSVGLEARAGAGIKVRQPLSSLSLKEETLKGMEEYLALIRNEVNVKHILFNKTLEEEALIDTAITEGLRREGSLRELIRAVQEERKRQNLKPGDAITLSVAASADETHTLKEFNTELRKAIGAVRLEVKERPEGATTPTAGFQFTVTRA